MENNMYIYSLTFDYISVCANDDDDGDNEWGSWLVKCFSCDKCQRYIEMGGKWNIE